MTANKLKLLSLPVWITVVSPQVRFAPSRFAPTQSRFAPTQSRFAPTEKSFRPNLKLFSLK